MLGKGPLCEYLQISGHMKNNEGSDERFYTRA
jgi:hypothetical protein